MGEGESEFLGKSNKQGIKINEGSEFLGREGANISK